jgi:hypothetical protein
MLKAVFVSITDTVTFLLNTPIVPPRPKGTKDSDVALTELPHSIPRRCIELQRTRSADLADGDNICLAVSIPTALALNSELNNSLDR